MLIVTSILIGGILSGFFLKKRIDTRSAPDKIMTALVVILLFLMGYFLGSDKLLVKKLIIAGRNALLISIGSVLGSVLLSFPVYYFLFRDENED